MEVTSLNFESVFPEIIGAYLRCSFITIDCEFSGVRAFEKDDVPVRTSLRGRAEPAPSSAEGNPNGRKTEGGGESPLREKAYRRLRSAAQKYTVLQLGVTFAWLEKGKCIASCSVLTLSRAATRIIGQISKAHVSTDHHGHEIFKTETYSFLVNPFLDWLTGEGARACRAIERDVTVTSATAQFLQSSKFDFHALFTDGLRYLSHAEEKGLWKYVSERPGGSREKEKW